MSQLTTSDSYRHTLKSVAGRTKQRGSFTPGSNDLRWRGPVQGRQEAELLHEAWSEWLPSFEWQWYATFTIDNRPMSSNGIRKHLQKYLHWVSKSAGIPAYGFFADEYGEQTGRLHVHALLGNVGSLKPDCGHRAKDDQGRKCCGKHAWPLGWTRVYEIDNNQPLRDLAYYLSKYVTKANGEYDLLGFTPQKIMRFGGQGTDKGTGK